MGDQLKKLLLVNVADPWLRDGGDRPSLGTLYIASWLRYTESAIPDVIDLNHDGDDGLLKRLQEFKPDYIGVSLTTPQYEEAVRIARKVKNEFSEIPIIAGGPHPTSVLRVPKVPEIMPTDLFDYVITGAGEKTLERICREGLPNQRIIYGEPYPLQKSLDWLPAPARDLVHMEKYNLKILGKKAQPIMTSFGCPYHCTFCSEPIINPIFKAYSQERVVHEMRELKENWGVEAFIIYDDVYSIDSKRAMAIADLMIKEKLDLIYRCTTRATDFVRHPNLLPKLRDSGCVEICIGVESGDDEILKLNDKGMDVETNKKGIKAIKDHGIKCLTYMITGLPGCSYESEAKSWQFIEETEPHEVGWYLLAPFPSTPLWANREKYGLTIYEDEIIKNNWDVAQCRADNENLTCYIDYNKVNGLNRHQIKDLWLYNRAKLDDYMNSRGRVSIQYASLLNLNNKGNGEDVYKTEKVNPNYNK